MTVGQLIKRLETLPKNTVVQVGATRGWEYCQGGITDIKVDVSRIDKPDKKCVLLLGDRNKELGW